MDLEERQKMSFATSKDNKINVTNQLYPSLLSSSQEQLQTAKSKETLKTPIRKLLIRDPGSRHSEVYSAPRGVRICAVHKLDTDNLQYLETLQCFIHFSAQGIPVSTTAQGIPVYRGDRRCYLSSDVRNSPFVSSSQLFVLHTQHKTQYSLQRLF